MLLLSEIGTIMELGVSPLLTTGLITQILAKSNILILNSRNNNTTNKSLKNSEQRIQKCMAVILCLFQAILYVYSGMYGKISTIGEGNAILIVFQLFGGGLFVILFDDILSNGYGLHSSGVSLFVTINVCTDIMWRILSPTNIFTTTNKVVNKDFIGILPSTMKALYISCQQPSRVLKLLFNCFINRGIGMSTIVGLLATVIIGMMMTYLRGCKVQIALQKKDLKYYDRNVTNNTNNFNTYSIRLLYTSNMPNILYSAAISNLYIISQMMYKSHPKVALVKLLGVWKPYAENSGTIILLHL